jgi:hypothetical protein
MKIEFITRPSWVVNNIQHGDIYVNDIDKGWASIDDARELAELMGCIVDFRMEEDALIAHPRRGA